MPSTMFVGSTPRDGVGEVHSVHAPKPREGHAEHAVVVEALNRMKALGVAEVVAYAGNQDAEAARP